MLKRNKVLVAFMLVAVLCMSIGFAAISDTLTAGGNVDIAYSGDALNEQLDKQIKFTNVTKNTGTGVNTNVTANINTSGDSDTITIDIPADALVEQGKTIVFVATVSNESKVQAANLAVSVSNGQSIENGTVTVAATPASTTVAADGTTDITITVTLAKIPAAAITDGAFTVTIEATPAN